MGFESGSISFRAFYLASQLPEDHLERFSQHAAPPMDSVGRDPAQGWVTGRHLLDRNIVEETAYLGGYLRLSLMKAERKVPMPLLRAECMMEELAAIQASGEAFLPRPERTKIRKEITERLLPQMPPQLSGISMVCGKQDDFLFATAIGDKQIDALTLAFNSTVGIELVPITPETASLKRKQFSTRQLSPCSFSPNCKDEDAPDLVGFDFMTWLLFYCEERGGLVESGQGEFSVMLEGPLLFFMEGAGAHEVRINKGAPLLSGESNTALRSGKKLRRARLTIARGEEQWSADMDGADFAIRGLKLPKAPPMDAASAYQERIISTRTFVSTFLAVYDIFIEERRDTTVWANVKRDMHKWVSTREGTG